MIEVPETEYFEIGDNTTINAHRLASRLVVRNGPPGRLFIRVIGATRQADLRLEQGNGVVRLSHASLGNDALPGTRDGAFGTWGAPLNLYDLRLPKLQRDERICAKGGEELIRQRRLEFPAATATINGAPVGRSVASTAVALAL